MVSRLNRKRGYSLFELLITVAVIGIVSAVAVPAYRSYIETANMTKVTANFQEAIRLTRNTLVKDRTRLAIGLPASAPVNTDGWIALFNKSGALAPGGGPAYIPSTNNTKDRGDRIGGAVGVNWGTAKTGENLMELWRPLYLGLIEQRAWITEDKLIVQSQRKP